MIKRYQDYEGGVHEHFLGDYVKYEDHLAIVEKLKDKIKDLEGHLVDAMYRIGF